MTNIPLLRPALVAVFAFALSGAVYAADMDKSSPVLARSPAPASASTGTGACTDSSGKAVTNPSVCASGTCKDSSGKPVSDPAACAVSAPESARGAGYDLKKGTR